ncbi:hypothetical protein D3C72_1950510 [compost metagenome]
MVRDGLLQVVGRIVNAFQADHHRLPVALLQLFNQTIEKLQVRQIVKVVHHHRDKAGFAAVQALGDGVWRIA